MTTEHPEDAHKNAPRYAVLLYGLQRVKGAARRIPARRGQHGGEVPAVESNKSRAHLLRRHGQLQSNRPAPDRATDPAQRLAELIPQLVERRLSRRRPRRHHEIQVPGSFGDAGVEYLSEPPSHGVSRYRVADLSGDGEPEPRGAMLVWKGVHGEELAPVSGALTVDPLEFGRVSQTHSLATGQRSDCQTLAAPAPAVSDDPAPAYRAHALAKAVCLGPLAAIWLISTLHWTPLQALRSIQSTDESISEAGNAIQQSRDQVRPREYETTRYISQKNAAKWRLECALALRRPSSYWV
ncbi:MAG: hypothetical protein K0Q96_1628 [Rubrobacteraceae bacterium]|nr:hypothetical protein [Rubrobacteraceae bacterium]